jgi:hypothetical protein
MAMTPMPNIEIDCISRQQLAHACGQRLFPGSAEDMKMIGEQGPGVYIHPFFFSQGRKARKKIGSILVFEKYLLFFDASAHHVVQDPRGI